MKNYRYFLLSLLIIALDQGIKIAVHTWMEPGYFGQIPLIGDFFKLHYTLNPGMAFGIQIGSIWGKLILTTFRIVAMFGIGYYLHSLTVKNSPWGLLVSVALILFSMAFGLIMRQLERPCSGSMAKLSTCSLPIFMKVIYPHGYRFGEVHITRPPFLTLRMQPSSVG
jgi:hypothetical protein